MTDGISLTSSQRDSLLSLQETTKLSDRTTLRLSTGRRVNSAVDDAVSFFRARSLNDRATNLSIRREDIQQGISSLNTALTGTSSVDSLLRQLRGVAESSRSQSSTERVETSQQFTRLLTQISNVVDDTQFQGLNLLNSSTNNLDVSFSDDATSSLEVQGANLTSSAANGLFGLSGVYVADGNLAAAGSVFSRFAFSGLVGGAGGTGGFSLIGDDNVNISRVDTIVASIDTAISNLSTESSRLGVNAAILEVRLDYTEGYINDLKQGADNLVLANLNEEGANLLALQTRQQLGISALSLASQQQQAILGLIR